MSLLNELRNKSKATKDSLAFFGASIATGGIALIWLLSFASQPTPPAPADSVSLEETKGAFAQFFSGARAQLGSVLNSVEETVATSTATTTPPRATSSITIPTLTPESLQQLNPPRPIIIEVASSTE